MKIDGFSVDQSKQPLQLVALKQYISARGIQGGTGETTARSRAFTPHGDRGTPAKKRWYQA